MTDIDLGAEIAAVLPELQAAAESMMRDECTITRTDPDAPWLPDGDGIERPPEPAVVYEGKCKLQSFVPHESTPDVGGATVTVQRTMLHIPVSSPPVKPGDEVVVTASIGGLAGRRYRVSYDGPYKTWATATRVYVDEVS